MYALSRTVALSLFASLLLAAGAGCGSDPIKSLQGESCAKTDDCKKGLRCKNQVCVLAGLGDPCSKDEDCQSGMSCLAKVCAVGGRSDGGNQTKTDGGLPPDQGSNGSDGPTFDNVTGCQNWKSTMSSKTCGTLDMSTVLAGFDCSSFSGLPCDLAPYWQCLIDEFKCNSGQADMSGWPNCGTQHATCK